MRGTTKVKEQTTSTRKLVHIGDLTPDPKNARKHSPRNVGTIVAALHDVGAARSIVIDEHGVILAGNATIEAAGEAGITKLQVVDADGDTVVAVRRTGLSVKQKAKLALYDNRAAELADGWDADVLREMAAEQDLSSMFTADELSGLTTTAPGATVSEFSASDVDDAFWISIKGPLAQQAEALYRLREALKGIDGVQVELGTVDVVGGL